MTLVIACETIKEEVLYAADKVKCQFPILWMPSSLHKFPNKLQRQLQEQINSSECDVFVNRKIPHILIEISPTYS